MLKKDTWSLCKECYGIVPSELNFSKEHGAILSKVCEHHGEQSALIDPSIDFYQWVQESPKAFMSARTGMTALNVTNRCNVRCPGCYHLPDSSDDRPLDPLVKEAAKATKSVLGLMGAEPTMREDLPELIVALKERYKKHVMIYTNGIKLEDPEYVSALKKADLDLVALSLHLPSYIGEKAYGSKIKALENLKKQQVKIDHLAFSLRDMDDVDGALTTILGLDYESLNNGYVRIRAPSAIGGKRNIPAHLSEMTKVVLEACASRGLRVELVPFTNHMYAIMLKVEGRLVMLVRWPVAEEIDLLEAQNGPVKALFVPEIGETQILHQVLMIERIRSGGAFPPAPPLNCPDIVSGRVT